MKLMYTDFEAIYMIRKGDTDAKVTMHDRFRLLIWKLSNLYIRNYNINFSYITDAYQAGLLGFEKSIRTYDMNLRAGLAHFIQIAVFDQIRTSLRPHISQRGMMNNYAQSLDSIVSEGMNVELHEVVACEK